jgi:hypothetical protein
LRGHGVTFGGVISDCASISVAFASGDARLSDLNVSTVALQVTEPCNIGWCPC